MLLVVAMGIPAMWFTWGAAFSVTLVAANQDLGFRSRFFRSYSMARRGCSSERPRLVNREYGNKVGL
jgi:hypothetical protein